MELLYVRRERLFGIGRLFFWGGEGIFKLMGGEGINIYITYLPSYIS